MGEFDDTNENGQYANDESDVNNIPDSDENTSIIDDLEPEIYYGPDNEMLCGIGRGVGLLFLNLYLPEAQQTLRIASSYFTLDGYELCRNSIRDNVQIEVLVGEKERTNLARAIADEFKRGVEYELGRTTVPLHDAVQSLLNRIEQRQFAIRGAREVTLHSRSSQVRWSRFHCKFFICDDNLVMTGSTNLTFNGLHKLGNDEQIEMSRDAQKVRSYIKYFKAVNSQSHDLLQQLEDILRGWLNMASPFDAYLRTLHYWYGQEYPDLGPDGHEPTYYQQAIIARAVGQLNQYNGTLVLVATGLGKTIIGAEIARRLTSQFTFQRTVVIAPRVVEKQWEKQLDSRGLTVDFFDNGVLFKSNQDDDLGQTYSLNERLNRCDEKTVLLIDEVHRYRKVLLKREAQKNYVRRRKTQEPINNRVIERLAVAISKGAKIVLLTATPYGTDRQNINSLLYLLPHNNPTHSKPQHLFDVPKSEMPWEIVNLREVAELPVVTILGMLHVLKAACSRRDTEENGRIFIAMPDGSRQYLPKKIHLHKVLYPLFLETEVACAYDKKAFDAKRVPFDLWNDKEERAESGTSDASKNNALYAWQSSPRELARVVRFCRDAEDIPQNRKRSESISQAELDFLSDLEVAENEEFGEVTIQPSSESRYKAQFTLSKTRRHRILAPLLKLIEMVAAEKDPKFQRLIDCIRSHAGHRIIIFAKRHSTGVYLLNELAEVFPDLRIACTILEKSVALEKDGVEYQEPVYHLKTNNAREKIIKRFAPESNAKLLNSPIPKNKQFDVLICTDADGIGLNLQDACVVINYDLPSGADELLQRAGRVLRMTPYADREVYVYSFIPDVNEMKKAAMKKISLMINKLIERHEQSKDIIGGGGILPCDDDENPMVISLGFEDEVSKIPLKYSPIEDVLPSVSDSTLRHYALWDKNKEMAARMSGPLLSAKYISGKYAYIFVLVERESHGFKQYFHILFNIEKKKVEHRSFDAAMNLLLCSENQNKAVVSADEVERASLEALRAWWNEEHPREPFPERTEEFNRVCSVYLKPQSPHASDHAVENMVIEEVKRTARPLYKAK